MSDPKHILAITACPSGVAHTFMAAEKLAAAAQAMGHTIDVETHGSIGIEGAFSQQAIDRAEAVVIAADRQIDLSRFDGKRVVVSSVAEGIHRPSDLIQKGLAAAPITVAGGARPGDG